MEIASTRKLLIGAGLALAVAAAWKVANGEFLVPALITIAVAIAVAVQWLKVPADALLGGLVLIGYLVGNRGFAQLTVPGIPLLPGEAALGVGLAMLLWRLAVTKTMPVRRDPLNLLLLGWLAIGTIRLARDLPTHGIMAVRDFALVYYAVFFFLAQGWAERPEARRWIDRCLTIGFALATPAAAAFFLAPEATTRFTVSGVPLIFVKGDVAGSFLAAGVFWFGAKFIRSGRPGTIAGMTTCAAGIVLSNSRASLIALGIGVLAAAFLGGARMRRALAVLGAAVVLVLAIDAALPRDIGRHSRAFRLYESIRTSMDLTGTYIPASDDLDDKADNNRFRLVWWHAVYDEVRAGGPWLGLGFGHDLADEFVRRYYAENTEEFTARSPHNLLLTLFARMGLIGAAMFLAVVAAAFIRAWRLARDEADTRVAWLAPAMMLICSLFGVVLEGPMGAAVFWTMLGLVNASRAEPRPVPHEEPLDARQPIPTPAVSG